MRPSGTVFDGIAQVVPEQPDGVGCVFGVIRTGFDWFSLIPVSFVGVGVICCGDEGGEFERGAVMGGD